MICGIDQLIIDQWTGRGFILFRTERGFEFFRRVFQSLAFIAEPETSETIASGEQELRGRSATYQTRITSRS